MGAALTASKQARARAWSGRARALPLQAATRLSLLCAAARGLGAQCAVFLLRQCPGHTGLMAAEPVGSTSGSSDTSSTGEEERMRRLFQTCDGDGDGYISRNDLLMVCRQLNMEESVAEVMRQLGAHESGKISFQEFTRCRMQLVREIRKQEVELSVKSDDSCKRKKIRDRITSWPTGSDNSLGALSGAKESWEYDSGVRDLQSPDLQSSPTLQKLWEYGGGTLAHRAALQRILAQSTTLTSSVGGSYFELANTTPASLSATRPLRWAQRKWKCTYNGRSRSVTSIC